jgi:hypothetical protein
MVNQIYQVSKISIHQPSKISRKFNKRFLQSIPRKKNTDGFIGFSNNETNKIRLNGYADITRKHFSSGEQSIYWKSDGNDQKTFNANIELPYY